MQNTFDLLGVQRFVADLDAKRDGCNSEGMFCSDLDKAIQCHEIACSGLQFAVTAWAHQVFSGQAVFEPAVEAVFKAELQRAVNRARPLLENGRAVETECFVLACLDGLEKLVAGFEFMLKNWVRPQKSVAPAPRTTPGEAADKQIRERVTELPPLPTDWQPKDLRQARIFGERSRP